MKITSGAAPSESLALQRSAAVDSTPEAAAASAPGAPAAALQSEVLQPALAALRAMPEIDHERVAQLRDALAKGELPFDPARLAGLIQRFHGGKS
jgi:negative regulator of flagellin synthesis FlgM